MNSGYLFWNVDTQIDFVYPRGKLYVEGAEDLRHKWKELTELAKERSIAVINTADYHFKNSIEIDSSPDFINTFPEHCMANTRGADYIKETQPEEPLIFDWNKEYLLTEELFDTTQHRNFIIRKDAFDVFSGNPHIKVILSYLNPEVVVIYGVTTNHCIETTVKSLNKKVKEVFVVKDAVIGLSGNKLPYKEWERAGVKVIKLTELNKLLN